METRSHTGHWWAVAMGNTDPIEPQGSPLPDGPSRRFTEVCDRFEVQWRRGDRPRIESYLDDVAPADRPDLLRELVVREMGLRAAAGENPAWFEYLKRFPSDAGPILDATGGESTADSSAGTGRPPLDRPATQDVSVPVPRSEESARRGA